MSEPNPFENQNEEDGLIRGGLVDRFVGTLILGAIGITAIFLILSGLLLEENLESLLAGISIGLTSLIALLIWRRYPVNFYWLFLYSIPFFVFSLVIYGSLSALTGT